MNNQPPPVPFLWGGGVKNQKDLGEMKKKQKFLVKITKFMVGPPKKKKKRSKSQKKKKPFGFFKTTTTQKGLMCNKCCLGGGKKPLSGFYDFG